MQLVHTPPREEERQQAREALARMLARSLFAEWLAEQAKAGNIPQDAVAAMQTTDEAAP
jgi:hypothetical protein